MLITRTATFGHTPTPPTARVELACSVCFERSYAFHTARRRATYRGREYEVCGPCNKRLYDAAGQIESLGFRFRFIEKTELPAGMIADASFANLPVKKKVFKILLLLKERQEIRQKEVNWMAEEKAKQILKLPDRIAAIVAKTYVMLGDGFKVDAEEALIRIRDLLEEIDEKIIDRNKNKRLP